MANETVGMTPDKVIELRKNYGQYYQSLHEIQKEDDKYYELTYDSEVPAEHGYQDIRPPTAREWVEVGIRNYTLDNPKAVVKARGVSDAERKRDMAVESFQNYFLERIIADIKDATKKLLIRGEVFFNVWMDDTYFGASTEEEKKKKLYHFPLGLSVPDPINTFPSPAHNGLIPRDVIEFYEITVAEAYNLCELNKWDWTTDKKLTDKVKWTSYVSATERCFLLGDTPVLTPAIQPNILGLCNYVHIDAGLGHKSYEGKPEYQHRSMIFSRKAMLKMQGRLLSQMDAMAARYAWRQAMITGEEADVEKLYPEGKLDIFNPNVPIRASERVKVEFVSGEGIPPSILQQLAMTAGMAQPPEVLSGTRPPGVYSAQGVDTLAAKAKPQYKDPFKNMEDGLATVMDMGMRILGGVYKDDVAIGDAIVGDAKNTKLLKTTDIEGYTGCKVKLLSEAPEATEMRKILGDNEQKAGVISHFTNLTLHHDMSKEEAKQEIARIMAENAMNQPGSLEFIGRDAQQRLGMEQAGEEADAEGKKVSKHVHNRGGEGEQAVGKSYNQARKQGRTSGGMEAQSTPGEVIRG